MMYTITEEEKLILGKPEEPEGLEAWIYFFAILGIDLPEMEEALGYEKGSLEEVISNDEKLSTALKRGKDLYEQCERIIENGKD